MGVDDLILFVAVLIGLGVVFFRINRRGYSVVFFINLLPFLLIWSVIGARIFHVLSPPISMVSRGITTQYYFSHILDLIFVLSGGFSHLGAVVAGVGVLWWGTYRHAEDFYAWADVLVPGVLFSQAIAKWVDWVNQILYGLPTDLPWAIEIDVIHRLIGYGDQARYHPLFFYESIGLLIFGLVFLWLEAKRPDLLSTGDLFSFYMIGYGVLRWGLEFISLDISLVAGYNFNQIAAVILIVFGSCLLYVRHASWGKLT